MSMVYFCCDERRREAVRDHISLNGIDFLEVLDREAPAGSPPQQTLLIHCLKPINSITQENVRIEGGERITPVRVLWAYPAPAIPEELTNSEERRFISSLTESDKLLVVRTDSSGDFSTYRLKLVKSQEDDSRPDDFDPIIRAVDFSFKVECPSDFDCKSKPICFTEPQLEPDIDYLAKDYASFRQLMLDRMSLLLPKWKERNPADMGVAIIELLAYVGDHLSYTQDAIATEAYLDTAHHRTSVRRHTRLVDYHMHDGCNARVWIQVEVNAETTLETSTKLLTTVGGESSRLSEEAYINALRQKPEVFESLHVARLYPRHNQIRFYTWGDENCCLPQGANQATLVDRPDLDEGVSPSTRLHLIPGDVLMFIEQISPTTGKPEDADITRRHAVRLTKVLPEPILIRHSDGSIIDIIPGEPLEDPLTQIPIVEIEWHKDDALPFPFCVSSHSRVELGEEYIENVSLALGNIVLADHGRTVEEPLDPVPEASLSYAVTTSGHHCKPRTQQLIPPRYYPQLSESPLTQAATVPTTNQLSRTAFNVTDPASAAFQWQFRDVLPAIILVDDTMSWHPRRDLLGSDRFAREFVVEVNNQGQTFLRFSQDGSGLSPASGTRFTARYRVGNGTVGNVGANTITHIVSQNDAVQKVWNPLPASKGVDQESIESAVQSAPFAFKVQERAVTPEDWSEVAKRYPGVHQAAATFRWTGSWYTIFISVDRQGGLPIDSEFEQGFRRHLEQYRLTGYDLEIDDPRYVSLEVEILVCVSPDYFRSDVKAALLDVLSNRTLPDGRLGAFHPDNLTFGQPVYLSPLYATAQAVTGVNSINIKIFQRQGTPSQAALNSGKLELDRLEIARLQNDPNYPERGVLRLCMEGGK